MPWKNGYTTTDERSLDDVAWPERRRCALLIVVDLAVRSGADGIEPRHLAAADAEFGIHVGLPRLLDLFARYDLRATFAVPAVVAETYPDRIREIAARGHEVAAHGLRHEDVSRLAPDEEARRLAATTETLATITGGRPAGWYSLPRQGDPFAGGTISPRTIDLLIDAGYEYMGNGMADDVPYWWVTDFASRRAILTLPYLCHFDDQFFLMFPAPGRGSNLERPEALYRNWKAELDAQVTFGRCFTMVLHPYLTGWGQRLALVDALLTHVRQGPPLWNATAIDCARYWTATCPAATTLKLEPSTWRDYPGSLS